MPVSVQWEALRFPENLPQDFFVSFLETFVVVMGYCYSVVVVPRCHHCYWTDIVFQWSEKWVPAFYHRRNGPTRDNRSGKLSVMDIQNLSKRTDIVQGRGKQQTSVTVVVWNTSCFSLWSASRTAVRWQLHEWQAPFRRKERTGEFRISSDCWLSILSIEWLCCGIFGCMKGEINNESMINLSSIHESWPWKKAMQLAIDSFTRS